MANMLIEALAYMHGKGVPHGQITMKKVLVTRPGVELRRSEICAE